MKKETLNDKKQNPDKWKRCAYCNSFNRILFCLDCIKEDQDERIKQLEDWIVSNKGCYQLGFEVVKTKELFEEIKKIFGDGK